MHQTQIDRERKTLQEERRRERLLGLLDDERANDTALDRLGLRLARGGDAPDPVLAEVLAMAKPGCEDELVGLCGAMRGGPDAPDQQCL